MNDHHQLHRLGAFVHGVLFGLHALGFVYNVSHKNKLGSVIHAGAAVYDLQAVFDHVRETQGVATT